MDGTQTEGEILSMSGRQISNNRRRSSRLGRDENGQFQRQLGDCRHVTPSTKDRALNKEKDKTE
jgi:hypothetical protein